MAVGRMAPTAALGGVSSPPCPLQWLPCVFAIAEDTFVSVTLTPRVCRVLATLVRTAIFTPFGSRVHLRRFNFKRQNLSRFPLTRDVRFCL